MNEKMNFKISTGLKNIIGKELITNEVVAVFELVKNSYDANAKNVEIILDLKQNKISIIDDGIGMSKSDLENKWLFVAYSEKKINKNNNSRQYVGAKGIGRFACDRLGETLNIISKTKEEKFYNNIYIEWNEFEDNSDSQFINIPVKYSILNLCNLIKKSGTVIEINQLSDNWDSNRIIRLKRSLEKLINPFGFEIDMKINLKIISDDNKITSLEGNIRNNLLSALEEKTIFIKCDFTESINLKLIDRGMEVYSLKSKSNKTGLKNIEMCLYYLNNSAKTHFTKTMGINQKEYGSIFVFKNGFRVYPYGEIKHDTLGLDTRKTQGHSRFLGNREVIGYISIADSSNKFIEVSSRDRGFLENSHYNALVESYMKYVHKSLERYVNLIKWGYSISADEEIFISSIDINNKKQLLPTFVKEEDYNININKEVLNRINKPIEVQIKEASGNEELSVDEAKNLLKKSHEIINDKKEEILEFRNKDLMKSKTIEGLENQNSMLKSLTKDEEVLQSEITHHISKMSNEIDSTIENIVEYTKDNNILKELANIKLVSDKMRVFNEVLLKGNFSSKGISKINLFDYFDFYFKNSSLIKKLSRTKNIAVNIENVKSIDIWEVSVDIYEISVIIDNLISNAIDLDANIIDIMFMNNRTIKIYTDTEFINQNNLNKIFELGFSTKIGGTGIGLFQIKSIVEKNNWNIEVKNSDSGVEFFIKLGVYNEK